MSLLFLYRLWMVDIGGWRPSGRGGVFLSAKLERIQGKNTGRELSERKERTAKR